MLYRECAAFMPSADDKLANHHHAGQLKVPAGRAFMHIALRNRVSTNRRCVAVTDEGLAAVGRQLRQLRVLRLYANSGISDAGLKPLAGLQHLEVGSALGWCRATSSFM